jgi:hypothetical protein
MITIAILTAAFGLTLRALMLSNERNNNESDKLKKL